MKTLFPFLHKIVLVFLTFGCAAQATQNKPLLWNVPVNGASFVGRKEFLNRLETKINNPSPVVVTGLSGIGKSALTFAYARNHYRDYRVIWVFDASKGMDDQMKEFAKRLHEITGKKTPLAPQDGKEASYFVKTLLRTAAFSWLLIFDNAPSFASMEAHFPHTSPESGKDILVSSASSQGAPISSIVELTPFSSLESMAYLKEGIPGGNESDLASLGESFGHHPMALSQAVGYINHTPAMEIGTYISLFNHNKEAFWNGEQKALHGQTLLHTSLRMSLSKLQQECPESYETLCFLAMCDTQHLGKSLVNQWFVHTTGGDMGAFTQLIARSFVAGASGEGADNSFSVHGYLRDVLLSEASMELKQKTATRGARFFNTLFPQSVEDCVTRFEKEPNLVSHLKHFLAQKCIVPGDDIFNIGLRLFYYTGSIERDYLYAAPLSESLKEMIVTGDISDPYLTGVFYSWYGDAKVTTHGIDAAIEAFNQGRESFKRADATKSRYEHVMLLANNLGFFLHWKGDLEAAVQCLEEAKALQADNKEILPLSAIDELETVLSQDRGNFEHSLKVVDAELTRLQEDPVLYRVDGHFAKSLKACSLLKLAQRKAFDNFEEDALALRKEALAVSQDAYEHAVASSDGNVDAETIGRTLVYLSQAQTNLGKYRDGEESARRAITIFDKDYSGTHVTRRQGVAHMSLADAYMGQGRYEEARAAYLMAEEIFERISTHKAFDDMSELYEKLVALGLKMGDNVDARFLVEVYKERHAATFSMEHPRLVKIMANIMSANL